MSDLLALLEAKAASNPRSMMAAPVEDSPPVADEAGVDATPQERNGAIVDRVRELLDKYPGLRSGQLHDMAVRMDPAIGDLTLRSFHARYVLPIKRERARAEGRLRPPTRKPRKRGSKRGVGGDEMALEAAAPGTARSARQARAAAEAAASEETRKRVREIVLRYVRDVAATESRYDLVELIGGIDDVVTSILDVSRA